MNLYKGGGCYSGFLFDFYSFTKSLKSSKSEVF